MNCIKAYLSAKFMHFSWDLAFMEYDGLVNEQLLYKQYKVIKNPYKNKWFADPFILCSNKDSAELLVEEFDYDIGRGRIAKLVIDKEKNTIADCKILLDLPSHLSFPAIYRINETIYVVPENSASGSSTLYKYDTHESKLIKIQQVSELPLVDSVFLKSEDGSYVFATQMPNPNGCVLRCFKCDSIKGPYTHFKDFCFSSNIGRMGGAFIESENTYIRPAQNCNGDYGKSIIFQKVSLGNNIEFDTLFELKPKEFKYQGIHTFNVFNDIAVIDLKKYDHPYLYSIRCFIKRIMNI